MKNHHNGFLYNLGKYLGLPLAWVLKKEQKLADRLVTKGISLKSARILLTTANLIIVITLLFTLVPNWVILLIIVLTVFAYKGINVDDFIPQQSGQEWRMGIEGYGLYDNLLNIRIDFENTENDY